MSEDERLTMGGDCAMCGAEDVEVGDDGMCACAREHLGQLAAIRSVIQDVADTRVEFHDRDCPMQDPDDQDKRAEDPECLGCRIEIAAGIE